MSKGYVYILTNESMPGLVKIGMTRRTSEQRAKELSDATGVPCPFSVYAEFYSPDCQRLEAIIHAELAEQRLSAAREFFECSPWVAEKFCAAAHMLLIEEYVGEFAPDHLLVNDLYCVDEPDFSQIASNLEVEPEDLVSVLLLMRKEEAAPAIKRLKEKIASRKARMAAGLPAFDGTDKTRIREKNG